MNAEEKRLLWMIALGVVRRVANKEWVGVQAVVRTMIGDEDVSEIASQLYAHEYTDLPAFDPKAKTRQWFLTDKGRREL